VRRNKTLGRLAAAFASVALLLACKDSVSPTQPKFVATPAPMQPPSATPTPTPTPASSEVSQWDLTDQVVADAGPDFCIWTAKLGMVFHGTYTIRRTGNSLSFTPADIVDWESYTATLQGASFTASNPPIEETDCAHYWQSSSLSGSFSPDGRRLTATEIWSFTPDSGQVKTVTFQWSAVRR